MAHEGVFYFGVLASILSKSRLFSFSYIDRYILLFILLGIVSLGFDIVFGNSWGGFRAFRWHILTPSIIYILIRLNEKKVYSRDILSAFLIGSLFSSFILISNWLQFESSRNDLNISDSFRLTSSGLVMYISYSICRFTYSKKYFKGLSYYYIFCVYITLNRSLFLLIIFLEIYYRFGGRFRLIKYYKSLVIAMGASFVLLSGFSEIPEVDIEKYKLIQQSDARLFSLELFLFDLFDRVHIWSSFINQNHGLGWLFGSGLSNIEVGALSEGSQVYGSSHNVFISAYRSMGLIGVFFFLFITEKALSTLIDDQKRQVRNSTLLFALIGILSVAFSNDLFTGYRMNYLFFIVGLIVNERFRLNEIKD